MKKRIRTNGIIIFLTVVVIASFPGIFLEELNSGSLSNIKEIFGISLILLGQILRVSSRGYKSENSKNSHALIQDGPYGLVRHPMYLGILLIGFGVILALFRFWVIIIFGLFFLIRYLMLVLKEEKKLLSFFPDDYPGYKMKVKHMMIPGIKIILTKDITKYLPFKKSWLKREIIPIILVLCAVLLVSFYRFIASGEWAYCLYRLCFTLLAILVFAGLVLYLIRKGNKCSA